MTTPNRRRKDEDSDDRRKRNKKRSTIKGKENTKRRRPTTTQDPAPDKDGYPPQDRSTRLPEDPRPATFSPPSTPGTILDTPRPDVEWVFRLPKRPELLNGIRAGTRLRGTSRDGRILCLADRQGALGHVPDAVADSMLQQLVRQPASLQGEVRRIDGGSLEVRLCLVP